jgi:hypothetical protein
MTAPAFTMLSFSELDYTLQRAVHASTEGGSPERGEVWPISARAVISGRKALAKALERSKAFVDAVEPIAFSYFEAAYKDYYDDELSFAFYLALADCELAILDGRADLSCRRDDLLYVGGLLAQLRGNNPADVNDYSGMRCMSEKIDAATSKALDYPGGLNDGRLYLVWVAEMLSDIFLAWPASLSHRSFEFAYCMLDYISLGTGFMGWSLYFVRGGVNTAFLFEMSDQMKALALTNDEAWAYFWDKWDEKKIQILNDAVWGWVNFICFFFLFGGGMLGYYGDLLNGVLFVFDLVLSIWNYIETQAEFNALQVEYMTAIAATTLQWRKDDLRRDQRSVERAWEYQCSQLKLDALYSATVLLAVTLLCCFFMPPGMLLASTASHLILVGSVMCFGLGIVYEALCSRLQLLKMAEDSDDIRTEKEICSNAISDNVIENPNHARMMILKLFQIEKKEAYQKQLSQYHHAKKWCNMFFPVLFIEAFVLMPMTIGIAVFAVGVVLMFAANSTVARLAPKDVRDNSVTLTMLTSCSEWFFAPSENNNEAVETSLEDRYQSFYPARE